MTTLYQTTERGHFLHFYFMIFPSIILFSTESENFTQNYEIVECLPKEVMGLQQLSHLKREWTNHLWL